MPAATPPAGEAVPTQPAGDPKSAALHLANGDSIAGKVVDSSDPGGIIWQSPAFTAPFRFALNTVDSLHFPVREKTPQPVGNYCFELAGGDVLYGSLLALDEHEAEIDAAAWDGYMSSEACCGGCTVGSRRT